MVTRKVWDNVQPAEAFGGAESVDLNASRWEKPLQCALEPCPTAGCYHRPPLHPPVWPCRLLGVPEGEALHRCSADGLKGGRAWPGEKEDALGGSPPVYLKQASDLILQRLPF